MKPAKIIRRFLTPGFVVSGLCWLRYRCMVSPRSEVELSRFLSIGRGTQIGSFCKIKSAEGPLEIGSGVLIAVGCFITSDRGGVTIGDHAMIGPSAAIVGNNYRYDRLDVPICRQETTSKGIRIEGNVWVGANCVVLDGASIGSGAIISPNSVVSTKIPANAIAQGNPAKVVFTRR